MEREYHVPVLLKESVSGLEIKANGDYVDVTYGGGGHSREIFRHLNTGRLFAFDQDEDAAANIITNERFFFIRHNFKYMRNFLSFYGIDKVDGIIADLGVSSHDFDVADRGFSFRFEGNLDMRMNRNTNQSAADIINNYTEEKLRIIFREFGEIDNAGRLAKQVILSRNTIAINTISQFKQAIAPCTPKHLESKYLAKVFQALRIETNHEMDVLKEFLEQSIEILKPGGRLVVITYHSLEDRMVKNFIKSGDLTGRPEKDFFGNIECPLLAINRKVIVPTDEEIEINPRSRSAKLRIAEKKK